MNSQTDQQLLRDYTGRRSDAAFSELVRRHVDFVYSAALRMVCDSHLAEDVTQGVFVAFAKNAAQLTNRPVLSGWLHRTAQNISAQTVRTIERRRAREQEAVAMNELLANEPDAVWEHIAPCLDEALGLLNDTDRDALLLRYFERKSAREMAQTLGINEEAAKKRVNRAVERLREFFAKRGITVGASGLVVVITANAVQAAPLGLAATIATAAALAGTAIATTVTATKAIVMTTLQKTVITVALTGAIGLGIYEARQASILRSQNQFLQQQQAPLQDQIRQLQSERDAVSNRVVGLAEELASAKKNSMDLLKLRGEVGALRAQLADTRIATPQSKQPPLASAREYYDRAGNHYTNHDYEAQLEDLNKAIELDPNMAEAYFMRGNLYGHNLPKEKGGEGKALADYTRCLELKPNNSGARWNRANTYAHLRRYDEAIADWTVYIDGDTDFSDQLEGKTKSIAGAYFWRGRVHQMYLHDYSKAIADYTTALQMNPNAEDAHRLRGQCYESLGETEKARQDFAIQPKRN